MKSIFIDCNDQLDPVFARVLPAGRPADRGQHQAGRGRRPAAPDRRLRHLPRRPFLHADRARRAVPRAQAHRVPRHRRVELHGRRRRSKERGVTVHTIKGYGDTRGRRARHRADVRLRARPRAHGPRACAPAPGSPLEGVQLHGKTLGVIGLGGIGREVARIAQRHRHGGDRLEPHAARRTRGVPLVELDDLLARVRRRLAATSR